MAQRRSVLLLLTILSSLWLLQCSLPTAQASGSFAAFTPNESGEQVLEIGNGSIRRTVVFGKNGGLYTGQIVNLATGQNYIERNQTEFRLALSTADSVETTEINADEFRATDFQVFNENGVNRAQIQLVREFEGVNLTVQLNYEARDGENFVRKWLVIDPYDGAKKVIRRVTLEDWTPVAALRPVSATARYGVSYGDGTPNFQESITQNAVNTDTSEQRLSDTQTSEQVAVYANNTEGLYFFTASLFGHEKFSQAQVELWHTDWATLDSTYTSGASVLGAWQGAPEIGFKRYTEYIYNHYAVIKGKRTPVVFNTWFPYTSGIDEKLLLDTIDSMNNAGFYDTLHIDAGWQKDAPLTVNTERFPNGLQPIVDKLQASGKTLGIWMNPFSSHYESLEGYAALRQQHPEWVDPNDPNGRFCALSGAGDFVRSHLHELVSTTPLEEIYWDGADWNITNCQSADRNWQTPDEEYHKTIRFYADMLAEMRQLRPNLQVVVWSAPANIHWLSAVDQVQLSDVSTPPLLQSELVRRQESYYAGFNYPYTGIWGDWYGLSYGREWAEGVGQPLPLIKYALVSVIGNGAAQASALDFASTPAAVTDFMRQLFAWRKQFSRYFEVYQPVLGFPNGQQIDGEAHIIGGQGFIILYNPTPDLQTVRLPLDEPSLELNGDKSYSLSDWTELTTGAPLPSAKPGDAPTFSLPGYGYKVIGIGL